MNLDSKKIIAAINEATNDVVYIEHLKMYCLMLNNGVQITADRDYDVEFYKQGLRLASICELERVYHELARKFMEQGLKDFK